MSAKHPHEEALEYLQRHNMIKLFEILGAKVAFSQPADTNAFLISELKMIKELKAEGRKYSLFDETDIAAVFSSFDLTRRGFITKAQYEKALVVCGVSNPKLPTPDSDKIDQKTFVANMTAEVQHDAY